jgi:hypothetical protein
MSADIKGTKTIMIFSILQFQPASPSIQWGDHA